MTTVRRLGTLFALAATVYSLGVRRRLLRWGASRDEVREPYPGAELVPDGQRTATMAVTIDAPPSKIWPWLVQMGCDRAGWYSWDRLDNGGVHSAERIHPEWQTLSVGDRLASTPSGRTWFEVAALEPERFLALRASIDLQRGRPFDPRGHRPRFYVDALWAFQLKELPEARTRFIVSGYASARPRLLHAIADRLFWEPAHWIMQTRQFTNLKRRAERRALGTGDSHGCSSRARPGGPLIRTASHLVEGDVAQGFEVVREAFTDNFARRGEHGGACCAYRNGEKIVDLWGGIRNKQTGERWEKNTMVVVYSTTKGLAAMTLALAHSRGWLDYEERVCTYWPDFGQQGKERITVRQLLAHQAGLFELDEPIDRSIVRDLDRLAAVLARQKPAWEPGTRQAYHAITLGFYQAELLRRIDPQRRSLGQFFQDETASPLGLDLYIRLPEEIPNTHLATISRPGRLEMLLGFPLRLTLDTMNPRSKIVRALKGSDLPHDDERVYARNLEVPSGGAVGTARAIAHAYSVFATGGRELALRQETLDLLAAPAVPPARGFRDECLKAEVQFSLGFMKPSPAWPFGSPSSFGAPGAGGSFGFADPEAGLGYGYVTNRMGTRLTGDPRDVALRAALYSALDT